MRAHLTMCVHKPFTLLALLAFLASQISHSLGSRINAKPQNLNDPPLATKEIGEKNDNYYYPAGQHGLATWACGVLHVAAGTPISLLWRAYRKEFRYWHPNRSRIEDTTLAEEKFQDIQTAYRILTEQLNPDEAERGPKQHRSGVAKGRGRGGAGAKQRRECLLLERAQAKAELRQRRSEQKAEQRRAEAEQKGVERDRQAEAACQAKSISHFQVGVFVVAKGLKEAAHLNGKAGVIQSSEEHSCRCVVNFEGDYGQKLLKIDNLELPWSLA